MAGTPPYFNNAYGDYYYLRPGGFVFRIPDEVSDDVATPANCALAQVLYGLRRAGMRAGRHRGHPGRRAGSASTRSRWRATWAPTA